MIVSMTNSQATGEEDPSVLWFQQGIPEAFKVFFFQYYPELFAFAKSFTGDGPAAYQLSIDAFFLCWSRRTEFTSDEKIKAFIYLATRNNCMDHLRRIADPAVTDKTALAGPVPDSLPPDILTDIYAYAAVGLRQQ
jgi:DNA-directed RNA polymerase specialized sigma24 family protein